MNRKKAWSMILLVLFLFTVMTGCTEKPTPQASSSSQSTVSVEEKRPTLKVLSFYAAFDPNANPIKKEIEKMTGYSVEYAMLPQDTEKADEKLNITVASGSEYDILKIRPYQYYRLAQQGALKELDTLIPQYGKTLETAIMPRTWSTAKYNGKIYAIPLRNERPTISNGIAIRQDLLDAAGIKIPTTLDEFTEMLRLIKQKYPKMIPMTGPGRVDTQIFLNVYVPLIAGAFGIYNEWTDINGILVHYMNMPGFKAYIEYMTSLYKEGLIDVDWPVNTLASCNEKFTSGKAVADPYHYNDATANFAALTKNFPEAKLVYINSLQGPFGNGLRIDSKINYFISVPTNSPNASHAIRFADSTVVYKNFEFLTLGTEGIHFTKKGTAFEPIMPIFNNERFWSYWYLMAIDETKYPDMWLARVKKDPAQYACFDAINQNIDKVGHLDVAGFAPTLKAIADNQQALRKQVDDFCTKIITGAESIDNYYKLLNKWKSDGGDAMIEAINGWYKDSPKQ